MKLSVEWTTPAQKDLAGIDDQLMLIDPDIADRVGKSAIAAAAFLSEHPRAGPDYGDGFQRRWRVRNTPYLLIYRLRGSCVQILRVMHDRSDWQSL